MKCLKKGSYKVTIFMLSSSLNLNTIQFTQMGSLSQIQERIKIRNGRAKIYNRKTSVAISLQFTQTVHGLNDPFYLQTSCTHHKKIKMFLIIAYYCLQIQIRWKRKSNQELVVFYHAMKRGSPPVLLSCYKPLHISSSWLPWN